MIKHRADSIKELNEKQAAEVKKDKTIAEQADTIELLKGCIMEVRLFAGEIIMGRITEDDVPAKLKARVHKYLVDMGYFDDVEE